jgi:hypothetical protein
VKALLLEMPWRSSPSLDGALTIQILEFNTPKEGNA